ncbi:MAG: NAD-dependent deacylase [Planctomycetota bacterium]
MTGDGMAVAAAMLRDATHVVVLTGAGVSAESGLATFRDPQADPSDPDAAYWSRSDPMQMATPEGFHANPALVQRWYRWRMHRGEAALPNPGHEAIARLEREMSRRGGSSTLLTQNVDGLHHAAGSELVFELHGSILRWRCARCSTPATDLGEPTEDTPMTCRCGGALRPGVVWFGEALPQDVLAAASEALERCDVFMSVGTSAVVFPAAGFIESARVRGASTIEVNRDPTPITSMVDVSLLGQSGDLLPRLIDAAFDGAG